jgi:hypothetical protein
MGDRDRRVHVDDQPTGQIGPGTGSPRPFPRLVTGLLDAHQMGVVDAVHTSPRRRVRGHSTEQLVLITQHRQMRQRIPAISDHHRKISQHPTWLVHRRNRLVGVQQHVGPAVGQTAPLGEFPQQRRPGPRHQPGTVSADLDPSRTSATLHLRGASLFG